MRQKQFLSAPETEHLHQKRLADLLCFSFRHVPYSRLIHGMNKTGSWVMIANWKLS
jgi:hypothetical protein